MKQKSAGGRASLEKSLTVGDLSMVTRRLDALIRITLETANSNGKPLTKELVVKSLNSAGLTPSEIARIFGSNKASDVSCYLYGKDKKKNNEVEKE